MIFVLKYLYLLLEYCLILYIFCYYDTMILYFVFLFFVLLTWRLQFSSLTRLLVLVRDTVWWSVVSSGVPSSNGKFMRMCTFLCFSSLRYLWFCLYKVFNKCQVNLFTLKLSPCEIPNIRFKKFSFFIFVSVSYCKFCVKYYVN